jgi:SAM-dependent methyltransferase
MPRKDLHEQNRVSWNVATDAHNSHKADQARFLREGGSTLFPEEVELLGDVRGLSLVHLQCNAGQDTLSIAHLGAQVTGVDISDTAIAFAKELSEASGIPATFERMDVYDWLEEAASKGLQCDIVFSSYGFLVWLSDVETWAKGVATILKPGGRFVMLEFHPFANTFDWDWTRKYPYFAGGKELTWEEGIGDYVALSGEVLAPSGYLEGVKDFKNPHPVHEFQWGIGEVATALLDAGMVITALREYPYSNGAKLFDRMLEMPDKRVYPPEDVPNLPLMYSLAARKEP